MTNIRENILNLTAAANNNSLSSVEGKISLVLFISIFITYIIILLYRCYIARNRPNTEEDGLHEVEATLTARKENMGNFRFHRDIKSFGTYQYEVEGEKYEKQIIFTQKTPPETMKLYYKEDPSLADEYVSVVSVPIALPIAAFAITAILVWLSISV